MAESDSTGWHGYLDDPQKDADGPHSWWTVAPIQSNWSVNLPPESTFEFEPRLSLEACPPWFLASTTNAFGVSDRWTIEHAKHAFVFRVETDDISDTDPISGRRWEAIALDRISHANAAMWIARPTLLCFSAFGHCRRHGGAWQAVETGKIPHVRGGALARASETRGADFATAQRILKSASNSSGSLKRAFRFLWRALTAETPEVRYVMIWIALEALFGPTDRGGVTRALTERMPRFLTPELGDAADIQARVGAAYDLRSKVVHGRDLPQSHIENPGESEKESEAFVRGAMLKILSNEALTSTFSDEESRESYFPA